MIFQEPMTAQDPVYTIGDQIAETVVRHEGCSHKAGMARALELLQVVKVPSPERRLKAYPHELSGGLRQRAMIALALSCCASCRRSSAWASSSSRTTWAWRRRSPTKSL